MKILIIRTTQQVNRYWIISMLIEQVLYCNVHHVIERQQRGTLEAN